MNTLLLETKGLSKTYIMGQINVHALRDVDITVNNGEFIAVMGASGSGKTTFMNLLGCLDKPTEGSYWLDEVEVHKMSSEQLTVIRNEKIGFVFQSFYLLPRTSALENVELPLLYSKKSSAQERKAKAMQALEIVGIAA